MRGNIGKLCRAEIRKIKLQMGKNSETGSLVAQVLRRKRSWKGIKISKILKNKTQSLIPEGLVSSGICVRDCFKIAPGPVECCTRSKGRLHKDEEF